jgi:DNA polymerase-1
MRHNMDILAETYLNYTQSIVELMIGKRGKNQKSMRIAVESQEYAVEDADTYQLKHHLHLS